MNDPRVDMFNSAVEALDNANIRYSILHGYSIFDTEIPSDIDCIVDPSVSLKSFVSTIETTGIRLIQHMQHESTCHYLVFVDPSYEHFLQLDISSDYRRNGVIFYTGWDILENSRRFKSLSVPAPSHEFGYYLAKKLAKGELTYRHGQYLSDLYSVDPIGSDNEIRRLLGARSSDLVSRSAVSANWQPVQAQISPIRAEMLRALRGQSRTSAFRYWFSDLMRRIRRVSKPTGIHVAVFGPDGAGKSTIIDQIAAKLMPGFRRSSMQHLFPTKAEGQSAIPVVNPHGSMPRNWIQSIAKINLWSLKYTVGYAKYIYLSLIRSTLVISDRYFPDIIVDPKRYRYGGPVWLPKFVWRILPKPDLAILLDAPAEVLQQRKQEVSFAETERQVEAYRALVGRMRNGHIVNADKPVGSIVADVDRIILDFMSARTRKRLGLKEPTGG